MPNGGSDCCGTCWFNRVNRGKRRAPRPPDPDVQPHCEIRNIAIEIPFYTYCANHPHRRPERDPIPIGPVTRYAGDGFSNKREVWVTSPDSEEIRQHLLELLENIVEQGFENRYPIGPSLVATIIRQLAEFREKRAKRSLRLLTENAPKPLAGLARNALSRIDREN